MSKVSRGASARSLAAFVAAVCVLAVGWPCLGTSIPPLGLKELAKGANRVVEGRVDAIRVCGDPRYIYTEVDLRVDRTFKGETGEKITFCVPGGYLEDAGIGMGVPGTPKFLVGERVILFLHDTRRGVQVYGFGQGAYHVKMGRGPDGKGVEVVEQDPAGPGTIVAAEERKDPDLRLLGKSVPHDRFVELVDACVNGRPLPADIGKLAEELPPIGSGATMVEPVGGSGWRLWAGALCGLAVVLALVAVARRRGRAAAKAMLLVLVAGGSVFLLRGETVQAYASLGHKWNLTGMSEARVPWEQSTDGTDDTIYEFEDVQAAFDEWEAIPNSAIAFKKTGTTATSTNAKDGHNIVAFSMAPEHPEHLATCFYWWDGTSNMIEADIIFNDSGYDWEARGQGGGDPTKTYKVKPVALHEIGHLVGLDHYGPPPTVIMNPIYNGLAGLTSDETSGAAALYPPSSYPAEPSMSASASPDQGAPPLTVFFSGSGRDDYEPARAVTYSWDFGDGITSAQQSPLHTYSAAGVYTVTLRVTTNRTNAGFNRSSTETLTIVAGEELDPVPTKNKVKLNFKKPAKDSLKMLVYLMGTDLPFTEDKADDKQTFDCFLTVGSGGSEVTYPITLNGKGKTVSDTNVKVKVNLKNDLVAIKVKNADLAAAMGIPTDEDATEQTVQVRVSLWIGDVLMSGPVTATYSAKAGKGAKGKF